MAQNISVRLSFEDYERFKAQLLALGPAGEAAFKRLEDAARPATRGLTAVDAAARDFKGSLQGLAAGLGPVGAALAALGPGGLAAAAGIAAATIGAAKLAGAVREAAGYANRLQDSAETLNIGVEALQAYRFAAELAGLSVEQFDRALAEMTQKVDAARRGDEGAAQLMRRLGVQLVDTAGKTRDGGALFRDFAQSIASVQDPAERLALALALFGERAGRQLVEVLKQGAEGLDEFERRARAMGIVLDRDLVARGAVAGRQIEILAKAIDVNLKSALIDLAPILVSVTGGLAAIAAAAARAVEGFRDLENLSLDALERRLAAIDEQLSVPTTIGEEDEGDIAALLEDRARVAARIAALRARRAETAGPAAGGAADLGIGFDKEKAAAQIRDLLAIREARDRLSLAIGRGVEAERAAELVNAESERLRKLGLESRDAEVRRIADFTGRTLEEARALDLTKLSRQEAIDLIGALTASEQRLGNAIKIRQQAEQENRRFDSEAAFAERIRQIKEYETTGLLSARAVAEATRQAEDARLASSREATDGITRAMRGIAFEAGDAAANMERAFRSGFKNMEDALVKFALTGKFSFADFANAVIADLIRIQIRASITAPLAGFLGSLFAPAGGGARAPETGGLFDYAAPHGGGVAGEVSRRIRAPAALVALAPRLHAGWPGLGRDEMPAILLRNERVLTEAQQQNTADTIRGLAALAAGGGGGRGITVLPTVYVNAPGVTARTQASWGGDGTLRLDTVVEQLEERMAGNVARGQGLARVFEDRYQLDPASGAYR